MGDLKTTIIYDGVDTWLVAPFLGKQKVDPEEAMMYRTDQDWLELDNATFAGFEPVNGRECAIVETVVDSTSRGKAWIDRATLAVVKGEMSEDSGGVFSWSCSDFRKVAGKWEIPGRTEMFDNGRMVSAMSVTGLQVNSGIADSLFDADKEASHSGVSEEMMHRMLEQMQSDSK